jgi:hypothetical protein
MLVAFRFYVSFISFLGFVHAKIRIILYKKELLYRKVGFSDFLMQVFPLENNHSNGVITVMKIVIYSGKSNNLCFS